MHGDLRDPAVVDRLLNGVDVLIHMAGTSVERPLPEISENNLRGLYEVYEGARRNGVRRVVFASSNHAFGMHSVKDKLRLDAPFRADGLYGLSKVWGEAMARMYWDKHGIEGISLRIGSALEKPTQFRHLSTWLGHDDLVRLIMCCIEAPRIGYMAVWGVSDNTRSYWDQTGSERLGYRPVQNAEDYAAEILAPGEPARRGRAAIPGRELRLVRLHAAREAAEARGVSRRRGAQRLRLDPERLIDNGPAARASRIGSPPRARAARAGSW